MSRCEPALSFSRAGCGASIDLDAEMLKKTTQMTPRLPSMVLSAAVCLLLAGAPSALAGPGALDPTFGKGGIVHSEFGPAFGQIAFTALDPQPDGSFYAALRHGSEGTAWTRRYEADGSRDQAYGETSTSEFLEATQADGKTLKVNCGDSLVRFEPDGTTPDPTFGDQPCGSQTRSDSVPFRIERILPLASGEILVAGSSMHYVTIAEEPDYVFEQLAIARYDEHGKLDPSFGGDGVVLLSSDLGFDAEQLLGLSARPGGGVVVLAADSFPSRYGVTVEPPATSLLGLTASGKLDASYGSAGIAHLDAVVTAFHPLGEGRILLAGDAVGAPLGADSLHESDLFLARYGDDGEPDASYGNGGFATADFGNIDLAGALLVEGDGSAVVGGAATDTHSSYCLRFYEPCPEEPVLAKFDADGQPDPAFGNAGRLRLDSLAYSFGAIAGGVGVKALAALPGEGILAGGGSGPDAFLAAMSANGALDGKFGQGGLARERAPRPSDNSGDSLGVDRDGRILVAGATNEGLTHWYPAGAVFRYLPNGALDRSYGSGLGYVHVPAAARISVAPDGSAIAAGANWPVTMTKLKANGEIDASFGEDGTTALPHGSVDMRRLASMALLPDGEVVLAGTGSLHGRPRIVVHRLRRNGNPNPSFGDDGTEVLAFGRNRRCAVMQMAVQPDGRIVLAGYVHGVEHEKRREVLAVMRLMPNGSRDRGFGRNGLVALRIGRRSLATALALGRGTILVGGRSWSGAKSAELLLRIEADGDLDRGFAHEGIVRIPVPPKPKSLNGPRTILLDRNEIVAIRHARDRQVLAFRADGRPIRSFPNPGALGSHRAQAAPPAALQNGRLLVLERSYGGAPSSFALRRLLLR